MNTLLTLASPAAIAALAITLGYIAACVVWPYAPCPRCRGTAKLTAPLGRAFRRCPRCRGTGLRLRLGRRAWNYLRRHTH